MAAALVIEWDNMGLPRDLKAKPVYILPWRWNNERVLDVMRCIYFNHPELFTVEKR